MHLSLDVLRLTDDGVSFVEAALAHELLVIARQVERPESPVDLDALGLEHGGDGGDFREEAERALEPRAVDDLDLEREIGVGALGQRNEGQILQGVDPARLAGDVDGPDLGIFGQVNRQELQGSIAHSINGAVEESPVLVDDGVDPGGLDPGGRGLLNHDLRQVIAELPPLVVGAERAVAKVAGVFPRRESVGLLGGSGLHS